MSPTPLTTIKIIYDVATKGTRNAIKAVTSGGSKKKKDKRNKKQHRIGTFK